MKSPPRCRNGEKKREKTTGKGKTIMDRKRVGEEKEKI
jgi:hypothetical protein